MLQVEKDSLGTTEETKEVRLSLWYSNSKKEKCMYR